MRIWTVSIVLVTIALILEPTGSTNTNCDSNEAEWKLSLQPYPGLKEYIEGRTASWQEDSGQPMNASRTLVELNWTDRTFQLTCPLTDVIEWRYHDRNGDESDEEFNVNGAYRQSRSQNLTFTVRKGHFGSYSCKNSSCCWHHFYVIRKPYVKTSTDIRLFEGGDIKFFCTVELKEDAHLDPNEDIHSGPYTIEWQFPNSGEQPENVDIRANSTEEWGTYKSTIKITNATSLNAGLYKCVITDKFNVSSFPLSTNKATPAYQHRGHGHAQVHVLPLSSIWTPLYAMLGMAIILPFMIKFLPTNEKEADLEEDDVIGPNRASLKLRNGKEGNGSDANLLKGSTSGTSDSKSKSGELALLHRKEE